MTRASLIPGPIREFQRPPIVQFLDPASLSPGEVHRVRVSLTENATGNESLAPVMVMRAEASGPTVGVTAVIHGNELNGIPVIHRLMHYLAETGLRCGTVIAVPIVNVPGYLRAQREFEDGADLNRIMPGRDNGNESQLYAFRFMDRIAKHFEVLIDLHTASFGRVNSLYVRGDMNDPETAALARSIAPQIILNSPDGDGTLRAAVARRGGKAITVEVGDPQLLQRGIVKSARLGIQEALECLGMVDNTADPEIGRVLECQDSYWLHTDRGGILRVLPDLVEHVEAGEVVAQLLNVWGDVVCEYLSPEAGVVIGKSTNPTARAGSRILHLGTQITSSR